MKKIEQINSEASAEYNCKNKEPDFRSMAAFQVNEHITQANGHREAFRYSGSESWRRNVKMQEAYLRKMYQLGARKEKSQC